MVVDWWAPIREELSLHRRLAARFRLLNANSRQALLSDRGHRILDEVHAAPWSSVTDLRSHADKEPRQERCGQADRRSHAAGVRRKGRTDRVVLTWEEIDKDWADVQQRTMLYERTEEAEAMYRYCIGHSITDVAKRVGKTLRWVQTRLEYYAAQAATGGIGSNTPIIGKQRGALEDVSKVVREFTPNVNVKLIDDGKGIQSIGSIEGDDSEEFAPSHVRLIDHVV